MTTQELYIELKVLINKNGRFTNIDYPKSNFVTLFNREQERWYSQTLKKKEDSDDINDIQNLLITRQLEFVDKKSNYSSYSLPSDWFRFELFEVEALRGCSKRLNARPISKLRNLNEILANEYSSPSFDWEETVYRIAGGNVFVYFSDFDVTNVDCTYYQKLPDVDMSGYIKLDNTASSDINPTLDNIYLRQILDRVALEIHGEVENQLGMQVSNNRIATQERIQF